jgi:hypothetical protein
MRYRIISNENTQSFNWVSQEVAGFLHKETAIAVCRSLRIPAYVIDALTGETLYTQPS